MANILVVDDAQDARDLVIQVLSEEHQVHAVASWYEAREYIESTALDLILLDVNMPEIKGGEIAGMLSQIEARTFKIILFSAMDQADLRRMAQEVGADGSIGKTFDSAMLLRKIRKLCS